MEIDTFRKWLEERVAISIRKDIGAARAMDI